MAAPATTEAEVEVDVISAVGGENRRGGRRALGQEGR